jgi:hypothetical protein
VGSIVASNQLIITNENSSFYVDASGARLNNASFIINNGKNTIALSPNEELVNGITTQGISIQKNDNGTWKNVFYADVDGNLILEGGITANFGDIGAWHIDDKGLYDDFGNYIYGDGNVKLGGLKVEPGRMTVTGDIYARRLFGRVVGADNYMYRSINDDFIDSLSADKIIAGTMIADRIYGGVMRGPGGIRLGLNNSGVAQLLANDRIELFTTISKNGISITNTSNIIYGYTIHPATFEFGGKIRVTRGGEGRTVSYSIPTTEGTKTLQFYNGILVDGNVGPWGEGGGGSGGGSGGTVGTIGGKVVWQYFVDAKNESGYSYPNLKLGYKYAVQGSGGPWNNGIGQLFYNFALDVGFGFGGSIGKTHTGFDLTNPPGCYGAVQIDDFYGATFFTATTTSFKIRVPDVSGQYGDNSGNLSFFLLEFPENEVPEV